MANIATLSTENNNYKIIFAVSFFVAGKITLTFVSQPDPRRQKLGGKIEVSGILLLLYKVTFSSFLLGMLCRACQKFNMKARNGSGVCSVIPCVAIRKDSDKIFDKTNLPVQYVVTNMIKFLMSSV